MKIGSFPIELEEGNIGKIHPYFPRQSLSQGRKTISVHQRRDAAEVPDKGKPSLWLFEDLFFRTQNGILLLGSGQIRTDFALLSPEGEASFAEMSRIWIGLWILGVLINGQACESPEAGLYHVEEKQVPNYELPEVLVDREGHPIETAAQWEAHRTTLLQQFRDEIYGHVPGELDSLTWVEHSRTNYESPFPYRRKEWEIRLWKGGKMHPMRVGLYLPGESETAVPVFLGISFSRLDQLFVPEVPLAMPNFPEAEPSIPSAAFLSSSEEAAPQWPLVTILSRGYGVVVLNNREIAIDLPRAFDRTVYPLFYGADQTQPQLREWGAISAWAWGLSRILDVMEADPEIDATRVATIGHSRYGKTALWAAAQDERFAMAISNNSGCAGAALFRRAFGENISEINRVFPHWFNDHFPTYNYKDQQIPLDQHQLLALMAPRPLYVASAAGDLWADPRGEYLSTYHASPVYGLYGFPVWQVESSPEVGTKRWLGPVGYHLRPGVHDLTAYDWERYLDFADEWLCVE